MFIGSGICSHKSVLRQKSTQNSFRHNFTETAATNYRKCTHIIKFVRKSIKINFNCIKINFCRGKEKEKNIKKRNIFILRGLNVWIVTNFRDRFAENKTAMKNKEMTQTELQITQIIEDRRKSVMEYAEEQMCEAYNEISQLLKEKSLKDINQKKIGGISISTLRELYRSTEPCIGKGRRDYLIEFIRAKALAFESQRSIYPNFMKVWSSEDLTYLASLLEEGKTINEISSLLGRHPSSILKRIEMLESRLTF